MLDRMTVLLTEEIDLIATPTGIDLCPGYFRGTFVACGARWYNTQVAGPGGVITGPHFKAGTDGARLNVYNEQQNPLVQAFNAGIDGISAAIVNTTGGIAFDLSKPHPLLDVTIPASISGGAVTWKARLGTFGFFRA